MQLLERDFFDKHSLRGMQDVHQALEILEHDLPEHGLGGLRNFNHTYLIITRNVRQAAKKRAFEHPEFLERFDALFAYYYLDALRKYVEGEAPPEAWRVAFDAARRDASPFIQMALGVNAHVNNDIPQVLADCSAKERHRDDYNLVNSVIGRSINEAIDELTPSGKTLDPKRPLIRAVYRRVMHIVVIAWRAMAWRNYKKFIGDTLDRPKLETRAGIAARAIQRLPL